MRFEFGLLLGVAAIANAVTGNAFHWFNKHRPTVGTTHIRPLTPRTHVTRQRKVSLVAQFLGVGFFFNESVHLFGVWHRCISGHAALPSALAMAAFAVTTRSSRWPHSVLLGPTI